MSDLVSMNSLYLMNDIWLELDEFRFPRRRLPLVLVMLPEYLIKALNIVQSPLPKLAVTDIDEDENVAIRLDSQPLLFSSNMNRSLLFSTARWPESKLDMKQPFSINKCTMYLQMTQKERKTTRTPPETRASARVHSIKEEDVVNVVQPATS